MNRLVTRFGRQTRSSQAPSPRWRIDPPSHDQATLLAESWATHGQTHRCHSLASEKPQLSAGVIGADDGTRTRDAHLGKVLGNPLRAAEQGRRCTSSRHRHLPQRPAGQTGLANRLASEPDRRSPAAPPRARTPRPSERQRPRCWVCEEPPSDGAPVATSCKPTPTSYGFEFLDLNRVITTAAANADL